MPSCPFSYFLCFFWHLPSNFVLFVHHSLTIKFLLFLISSPLTLYIPFPLFLASFQLFNFFRFFLSCYVPLKFLPHSLRFIVTPSSPTSPLAPLHPLFTFLTTQFLWVFITCVTFHFLFHLNLILFLSNYLKFLLFCSFLLLFLPYFLLSFLCHLCFFLLPGNTSFISQCQL